MLCYLRKAGTAIFLVCLAAVAMICTTACDEFFPSERSLDHITVSPTSRFMKTNDTVQLTVTGVNGNGDTNDLTSSASFSSSNTNVATLSSTTAGLITAVNNGSAVITITAQGISATSQINVFSGTLQTITLGPSNPTVTLGTTLTMTATGQFSDSTSSAITNLVTWTSSNTSVASVSSTGVVTPATAGTTTITASASTAAGNVTGTATVTVQ